MVGHFPELSMNTPGPHVAVAAQATALAPPVSRRQRLRLELLASVDSLHRRRADLISEGFIEDYVALHWLEWNGGALRLTAAGANMCERMREELT
jgi:hypothetical protein